MCKEQECVRSGARSQVHYSTEQDFPLQMKLVTGKDPRQVLVIWNSTFNERVELGGNMWPIGEKVA